MSGHSIQGNGPRSPLEVTPIDATCDLSQTSGSAAVDEVANYQAGTFVGRYRIVRELGHGGMGVVYEAHDPELERRVAIKILSARSRDDSDVASHRLRREAQAMAKLSHPNLVPVFDVGTHDGHVYLAMEYVPGGTLRERLEHAQLDWHGVVDLYLAAGRGLAAAHDAGIVHRDFKPDNVMLDADGRARVLDFGVAYYGESPELPPQRDATPSATPSESSLRLTRSGAMLGTPAFMAPEQLRGGPVDARSDQFSFCVSLWRAVYGVAPFAGPTMPVLADNVLAGRMETPPKGVRIPARLRRLLAKGLSIDPQRRYPTMHELLAELEAVRHRNRRRTLVAVAATVLGVTAVPLFHTPTPAPGVCGSEGERATAVWNETRRDAIRSAFAHANESAAFDRIDTSIGDSLTRWHEVRGATCDRAANKDAVPHLYETLSCLAARLVELESFAALLGNAPDEFVARGSAVATAAERLADATRCDDPVALRALPPPPPDERTRSDVQRVRVELAAARALHATGRRPAAIETVERIASHMRSIDYAPVWAETLVQLGELQTDAQDQAAAENTLIEAMDLAEATGHDRVTVAAATLLARLTGFQRGDLTAARMWARRASSAIAHMGGDETLTRAVHLALSRALMTRGRLDEALGEAELAHVDRNDPLSTAQHALVLTLLGRYPQARPYADRALDSFDPRHPEAAFFVGTMGILDAYEGHDATARRHLQRCVDLASDTTRPQPAYAAICSSFLAVVLSRAGEFEAANRSFDPAIAALSAQPDANVALLGQFHCHRGWSRVAQGRLDDARNDFERALAAWKSSHGDKHFVLARPLTGLAHLAWLAGDVAAAREQLDAAASLRSDGDDHPPEVAATHQGLARVLAHAGDREEARRHVEAAIAIYGALGPGYAVELEATRAILGDIERGPTVAKRRP